MTAHWISPFRKDKNLGLAINEAITQLNVTSEDFIILCDQDILFLLPDTKSHILDILEATDCDILGCMTNRLGSPTQLIPGVFDEASISRHILIAKLCWELNAEKCSQTEIVAGMLMCFRVKTWRRLGGFDVNRLNFDYLFCSRANRLGLKVGLMKGIYIFHLYRWGSADPANDYKHLEP